MPRNSTTSNAIIGDAKEMYAFIDKTKVLIDELVKSKKFALDGIDKMGDGFKDNIYEKFKDDFTKFSKYIDELNTYNEKTRAYYGKLAKVIDIWNSDPGAGIPQQKI
jgi:hypothetical protein